MFRLLACLGASAFATACCAPALADGRCGPNPCRADVSIAGHAEPQPIYPHETTSLKVTAKNNGYDGALKIDLQVTVANGLKILKITHYGGNSCHRKVQFVRCDLGDFRREQEAVVVVKVRGPKVGTFISQGKVYSSDVIDPNGGNNQVSMTIGVKPRPKQR
ncbi:MAG: hypothetical protein JWM71_391 [Solirubrobacteraceae bacterium]|nr:hypothetical protein [Solirubrobacteraceae bacterium]